jgi:hypothetical protein
MATLHRNMTVSPADFIIKIEAFDIRYRILLLESLLPPAFMPPIGEFGNINCGDILTNRTNKQQSWDKSWLSKAPCTAVSELPCNNVKEMQEYVRATSHCTCLPE